VIDFLNSQNSPIISVDVPSGVFIDEPSTGKAIVQADHAVSFQFPKLAFMMPENGKYVKNWSVVDIGISKTFISKEKTPYYLLDENEVSGIIKKRDRFAHKTDFGRLLIVAGSYGKMGAAILAAHACLKSGGGLVTVHIPECGYQIVQSALPEAMVSVDPNNHIIIDLLKPDNYDVIGIGPGIGTNVETYEVLSQLFRKFSKPVVLDADAINIISREKSFLNEIPKGSILTPHPGEFRRLVDFWHDDFERLEMQTNLSQDYGIYIVLKGAHTCITTPNGKVFFNTTGNPGMGTAGSGDVLTGILTALLGQGYSSEEACLLGVYLHGLSGDIAAEMLGEECVMAGDIIDYLPKAFFKIKSYKQPV
jgi:NAD(P)H-hydrate epimerase